LIRNGWWFVGDAASEKTLRDAGIVNALGLVAATTTDATNIYIVLTAKTLNPKLKIIARATEERAERHLKTPGLMWSFRLTPPRAPDRTELSPPQRA